MGTALCRPQGRQAIICAVGALLIAPAAEGLEQVMNSTG
jgi:hypothetical protein